MCLSKTLPRIQIFDFAAGLVVIPRAKCHHCTDCRYSFISAAAWKEDEKWNTKIIDMEWRSYNSTSKSEIAVMTRSGAGCGHIQPWRLRCRSPRNLVTRSPKSNTKVWRQDLPASCWWIPFSRLAWRLSGTWKSGRWYCNEEREKTWLTVVTFNQCSMPEGAKTSAAIVGSQGFARWRLKYRKFQRSGRNWTGEPMWRVTFRDIALVIRIIVASS